MISNTVLGVAVVAATLAYFIPGAGIALILLVLGNAILDDPGVERERTQQRAQYHARNRLLSEREGLTDREAAGNRLLKGMRDNRRG